VKVQVTGRQEGKTLQAVDWVRCHPGAAILCMSQEQAQDLKDRFGLTADQVRVIA
jgi:hypothetical protein